MNKAIILLSGGIDSTVILALALHQKKQCFAISFDYNQRHHLELEAAKEIAHYYQIPHTIIKIDSSAFVHSSLVTESLEIPENRTIKEMNQGIPNTYVPARNTLFLAYALGQCEMRDAQEIHFGPNIMDFHGYPDCRPAFLSAFQGVMNVATKQAIENQPPQLVTPLLYLDKAQIIHKGLELNAPLKLTLSCYNPKGNRNGCGQCDACVLREEGFKNQKND